jgi:hypothetical protein
VHVQDIQDRFAIQQLIADRAYLFDEQDAEGYGALFVPHGYGEIYFPGIVDACLRIESRSEIVKAIRLYFERARPVGQLTRTHFSSVRIEDLTESWSKARGIFLITQQSAASEDPVPLRTGVVEWEFERTDVGWRILRQSEYNDQAAAGAELAPQRDLVHPALRPL